MTIPQANTTASESKDEFLAMRIYIAETDTVEGGVHHGKHLWQMLLHTFQERGISGATVFRGIAGYGLTHRPHSLLSEYLAYDLPIVVEAIDRESRIRSLLPELQEMIGTGAIALEKIEMISLRKT
jgi:PII-like signaling protein